MTDRQFMDNMDLWSIRVILGFIAVYLLSIFALWVQPYFAPPVWSIGYDHGRYTVTPEQCVSGKFPSGAADLCGSFRSAELR